MNNYPNEQQEARRVVNNAAGLNAFLTRMYGWMSLAVLVSAATAFLVTRIQLSGQPLQTYLCIWSIGWTNPFPESRVT